LSVILQLQPFYGLEHLPHLIGAGFAFFVLDVHPGITLPWGLVHPVAGASPARCAEVVATNFAQIAETDILRIPHHLRNDCFDASHSIIINIIVKQSLMGLSNN
jgi:hypothetical protein